MWTEVNYVSSLIYEVLTCSTCNKIFMAFWQSASTSQLVECYGWCNKPWILQPQQGEIVLLHRSATEDSSFQAMHLQCTRYMYQQIWPCVSVCNHFSTVFRKWRWDTGRSTCLWKWVQTKTKSTRILVLWCGWCLWQCSQQRWMWTMRMHSLSLLCKHVCAFLQPSPCKRVNACKLSYLCDWCPGQISKRSLSRTVNSRSPSMHCKRCFQGVRHACINW